MYYEGVEEKNNNNTLSAVSHCNPFKVQQLDVQVVELYCGDMDLWKEKSIPYIFLACKKSWLYYC